MPSTGTTILLFAAGAAALALFASSDEVTGPNEPPKPTPDPIPVPPPLQGVPAGPVITTVALRSMPPAGPTHQGALRSDGSWTISTSAGALVAQSPPASSGESAFLNAWNTYAAGGVQGTIIRSGVMSGFTVRPPGCWAAAPQRWCYVTTWSPGLVRHDAQTRAIAITKALARVRART